MYLYLLTCVSGTNSSKVPSPTSQSGSKNTRSKNNLKSRSDEKKTLAESGKDTKMKSESRDLVYSNDKDVASSAKIQNVVDKFSKDNKGSRHVLMLQQQLYQEEQWQSEDHTPPEPFYSHYNYYHGYQNRHNYPNHHHHQDDYNNYHGYNVSNSFYHYGSQHNRSFTSYSSYRSLYESNSQNYRRNNQHNGYQNEYMHPTYDHRNRENYGNYPSDRDYNDKSGYTFQPITSPSPCPSSTSSSSIEIDQGDWDSLTGPVELMVSNLDYNISAKEWRKILFTTFHPHVRVCYCLKWMNVVFLSVDTSMFSYSFKSRILIVEIYIFTVSICFALNAISILAVIGNFGYPWIQTPFTLCTSNCFLLSEWYWVLILKSY